MTNVFKFYVPAGSRLTFKGWLINDTLRELEMEIPKINIKNLPGWSRISRNISPENKSFKFSLSSVSVLISRELKNFSVEKRKFRKFKMKVTCTYSMCESKSLVKPMYKCTIKEANIHEPYTKISKFEGVHMKGLSNLDVEFISFYKSVVKYFPRNLHRSFPRLVYVNINDCGLQEITWRDLLGLENLHTFAITNCRLKTLPDDLFINSPKLSKIYFGFNKIEFATSNLLKPLLGRPIMIFKLQKNETIDTLFDLEDPTSVKSLTDLMPIIDSQCKKPTPSYDSGILEKFEQLWTDRKHSDLLVCAGSKEFRVHKSVLAMRSSTLAKIFEFDMKVSELKIEDFSEQTVENLLKFIYTGSFNANMNARECLSIASNFHFAEMKLVCEKVLIDTLDNKNAFKLLKLGLQYNADYLTKEAFYVIESKFSHTLSENLMHQPEELDKLIKKKEEYESMLSKWITL